MAPSRVDTAPSVIVLTALTVPTNVDVAPVVNAAPMHQFTLAHDAPPDKVTRLLAAVVMAAVVVKLYTPVPLSTRVVPSVKALVEL
jgi:hypothetical protein